MILSYMFFILNNSDILEELNTHKKNVFIVVTLIIDLKL